MRAIDFIAQFCVFSREGQVRPASKSEVRRWIDGGGAMVNGERLEAQEAVDFPVFSLVLFPRGQRVTLR